MRFRHAAFLAILSMVPLAGQAVAATQANDNDTACGAVLCLAGQAMGQGGGSACTSYMASYFSIVRFHHGDFSPSRTASARMDFLNQCKSADSQTKNSDNSRYGRQWFGP
ncbi:MAG: TrbM/KikA/MpfK family conjugal transfer protein [Acidiphilium sp.]|nr:TrbM/KikA/MpfK family conjugal transfer protein [Acidiphilium sp.]MDD4937147.1 TrbM/KikA/MpfK family conjugal transfer protein [Acidiphilium sp.]